MGHGVTWDMGSELMSHILIFTWAKKPDPLSPEKVEAAQETEKV